MKKAFLLIGVLLALFGYMTYEWMQAEGWTFFSPKTAEGKTEMITPAATSTPILFVGDIMLGRYVETLSERAGDEQYPFKHIAEFLKQHITIANLEGPIPEVHKPTPINGFSFSFPSSAPRVLKEGGVTAVSLANNHMFDQGRKGYEDTKRALGAGGIAYFGGYAPTNEDYFQTALGSQKAIIYGITMIATGWDEEQAIQVAKKLRAEHPDQYLIAFLHWGDEYVTQNSYQRAFAHDLIDSGTDAIIGAHPHVVQGIETYKGKPIFYSLGNFIFDQYWQDALEDGYMLRLTRSPQGYVYDIIPIRSKRSMPAIAEGEQKGKILQAIRDQSASELKDSILAGTLYIPFNQE